jgi:microcystin-dependent protein
MSEAFVAEIRIFGFNFPPTGWAFCNGQLLPISQNTALFSLLGTYYGGDGRTTFALPDMQGNVPIQSGQGPGLSQYVIGETSGVPAVTLIQTETPQHNHTVGASQADGGDRSPNQEKFASGSGGVSMYATAANGNAQMAPQTIGIVGGSLPHNNMMPYLTLNFCIAMQGVFPPRN